MISIFSLSAFKRFVIYLSYVEKKLIQITFHLFNESEDKIDDWK